MRNFILILCTIISFSCQREVSNHEFEKKVFYEIFPNLIDSVCIDTRIYGSFPPHGKSIFDSRGKFIYSDTSNIIAERKLWREKIKLLKNDKAKLVIAFDPNILESHFDNSEEFKKFSLSDLQPVMLDADSLSFSLDINKMRSRGKFYLMNANKFPKGREIWDKRYNFIFNGALSVNRIQFNKTKTVGVLSAGFYCGGKCGQGFRIFIKKNNNKWQIVKIDPTWIS